MQQCPASAATSPTAAPDHALLALLQEQLGLQQRSIELQKQFIQAIALGHGTFVPSSPCSNSSAQPPVIISQSPADLLYKDKQPLLRNDSRAGTLVPSVLRMYCRYMCSGDGLKVFTCHPEWLMLTTQAMSAPRLKEMIITTLETLMVCHCLILTIAVGVLQNMNNAHTVAGLILSCSGYCVAAIAFMTTTLVFCVLKMVLAVADSNLKLWCKANSHVFILMNTTHNLIFNLMAPFLFLVFFHTLPTDSFSLPVRVGVSTGAILFTIFLIVLTGSALCAPARSAAHSGSFADVPICSDMTSNEATTEEARRILFDEAFNPDLEEVMSFYRATVEPKIIHGEEDFGGEETCFSTRGHRRSPWMIHRLIKREV